DADLEPGRVQVRQVPAFGRERLPQLAGPRGHGTQILHLVPAFAQQLVRAVERLLQHLPHGVIRRDVVGGRLETPDQALYSLQQRIVQVARYALAFAEPRFEADPDPA